MKVAFGAGIAKLIEHEEIFVVGLFFALRRLYVFQIGLDCLSDQDSAIGGCRRRRRRLAGANRSFARRGRFGCGDCERRYKAQVLKLRAHGSADDLLNEGLDAFPDEIYRRYFDRRRNGPEEWESIGPLRSRNKLRGRGFTIRQALSSWSFCGCRLTLEFEGL